MTVRVIGHGLIAVWLCMLPAGCVPPGPVDPSTVARYQRALAERGPHRRGSQGLEGLRPQSIGHVPKLKVTTQPSGAPARIELSLEDAIHRALANSQDIRVVSFDPAISRQETVRAAAEFDYVLFGAFKHEKQDVRTASAFGGGMSDTRVYSLGVKEKTVTGAQWSLAWTMTRTWDNGLFNSMRERWEQRADLQVTQPLLRDAWPEFNLARLRIARLSEKTSMSQFRQKVEEIVTQVVSTYWQLVQARREVQIQAELLDKTVETLNRVTERYKVGLDATAVQVKQAEAAVQTRRATLIRARKTVVDVQDALVRLVADEQINLLDRFELVPATAPGTASLGLEVSDQLLTALQHSPVLEQARLGIDAADINVRVARNQELPRLDFSASAGLQGLGPSGNNATDDFFTGDFLSYGVGLSLEYPIGNRERRAASQRARLERLKAIATLQNAMDQVAQGVKERIRQAQTTFEELQAQRAAVEAAKMQLQALDDTEKIRGRLTPEFLQVKLQAQETLAAAERGEVQAIVNYSIALAELERTKGTTLELHGVQVALPQLLNEEPFEAKASPVRP